MKNGISSRLSVILSYFPRNFIIREIFTTLTLTRTQAVRNPSPYIILYLLTSGFTYCHDWSFDNPAQGWYLQYITFCKYSLWLFSNYSIIIYMCVYDDDIVKMILRVIAKRLSGLKSLCSHWCNWDNIIRSVALPIFYICFQQVAWVMYT